MGFKCGIVGLPNVGKTTIFNALTKGHAPCAAYPFTTVEANVGMVCVPDPRLDKLGQIVPNDKVIHTSIEFVDVAGLVKGASHGEGLGNQFLSKIMEVEAIAHVVRCFQDSNVAHITGAVDPIRDIEVVEHELLLKDIEIMDKWIAKSEKLAKSGDKKIASALMFCKGIREKLNSGTPARLIEQIKTEDLKTSLNINLLTAKAVVFVVNVAESDIGKETPSIKAVKDYSSKQNSQVVVICGKAEEELVQLEEPDRIEFMKEMGLKNLSLTDIVRSGYELLGLITFFTTDSRQLRAWTITKGTKAPQAAGKIHTDFERGFIRAEVVGYQNFIDSGDEHKARERGLMRLEGKDYQVQDGDIVHFRFGV